MNNHEQLPSNRKKWQDETIESLVRTLNVLMRNHPQKSTPLMRELYDEIELRKSEDAFSQLKRMFRSNTATPLSDWNEFEFQFGSHHLGDNKDELSQAKGKLLEHFQVTKQVQAPAGLYAIYKDGKCLYIGKGQNLIHRLLSHFKASLGLEKAKAWDEFFTASENQGLLNIKWLQVGFGQEKDAGQKHTNETLRIVLERLWMNRILIESGFSEPTFEIQHSSIK